MLSIAGATLRTCQGINRRELVCAGGLGFLGLNLPGLLPGQAWAAASGNSRPATFGKAKSCLIIFLNGGASHHDTFDMKPDAPVGRLYGASDKKGAYPLDHPISPDQLAATIFHVLGIDPASQVATMLLRPWQICDAKPMLDLWEGKS